MALIETKSAANNAYDGIIHNGSPNPETIYGSNQSDSLYGEGGDDTIVPYLSSPGWRDTVNGGDGTDTLVVDFSGRLGGVSFAEVDVTSPGGTSIWYWISADTVEGETQIGSIDYRDFERFQVTGSSTADNSLRGGALDDYLVGGAGSDIIYGFGEVQFDSTGANSGNDTIDIGKGGSTGATTGVDTVQMGDNGDDHLIVDYSASTEIVRFAWYGGYGAGVDYYSGSAVTIGGVGTLYYSGVERFTLATGSANDVIATGNGADVIDAGGGNDSIDSGKGADKVDGGTGSDSWASDQSGVAAAILFNLNAAGATTLAGGAVVSGIEAFGNLVTGAGNDVLTALASGAPADTVTTGGGNDTVTLFSAGTAAATGSDSVGMGADGDDHLIVDYSASSEVVKFGWYGGYGGGVDYYSGGSSVTIAGVSKLLYSGVERFTVRTGSANDVIATGNGADVISGGAGNDTIDSGKGADKVDGGTGIDNWSSDQSGVAAAIILNLNLAGPTTIGGGAVVSGIERLGNLQTGLGNDVITTLASGGRADTVSTGAGNDSVTVYSAATGAATGSDTVHLGAGGDDHLIVHYAAATEAVKFTWYGGYGAGVDYYSSGSSVTIGGVSRLLYSGVERFTVRTGSANDVITTGNGADVISGGGGNDTIDSGKGADKVDGGTGIDSWASDQSGVAAAMILNLNLVGPTTLGGGAVVSGIERFGNLLTGTGNDVITTLAGGARADTINTGGGKDTVTVYSAATGAGTRLDTVAMGTEADGTGNDHLIVDYSAATEKVMFTFYSVSMIDEPGAHDHYTNALSVTIGGINTLSYSGVERFTVRTGSGNDYVEGSNRADVINTGSGNDSIYSRTGPDNVNGGAGADDWSASLSTATAAIVLNLNVTTPTTLAGGTIVQGIESFGYFGFETGSGNDVLTTWASGAYDDWVRTYAGNDTVTVFAATTALGTGNDTVDLGAGGTDHLIVDYSKSTERVVFGFAYAESAGADYRTEDVTIGGVSKLAYYGVDRFTVKAGSAGDSITTGSGADSLNGGGGADSMSGGAGNDTYYVDDIGDAVVEAGVTGGVDLVNSTVSYTLGADVEHLTLAGSSGASGTGNGSVNNITGNAGGNLLKGLGQNDILKGLAGNDTLQGGVGSDRLYGGTGNDVLRGDTLASDRGIDRFFFDSAPNATSNRDTIQDFNPTDDSIYLARSIFSAAGPAGTLAADAFYTMGVGTADAEDRIIYNKATGALFYDPDGTGALGAVQYATVTAGLTLSNADFIVF
ncbi:MAG TPA: calcium-binding protein [Allosphingosinicella sp.]